MSNHPLRRWRQGAGFTLSDIARAVGVTKSCLCKIEGRRQQPSLSLVARLIAVTHGAVSADDFLPATDSSSESEAA